MTSVDPYGGQYVTAGDPAVDVNGRGIESLRATDPSGVQNYYNTYGTMAPQVWAEDANRVYLANGQAIITPSGLISAAAALSAIQARGYKGATDAASVAQAYALLISQPPTTAVPPIAAGPGGTITLPIIGPVPTLAVAAAVLVGGYALLGRGRR
jgi:hypothetical protein